MQYSVKDLSSPIRENHKTCKVLVCYLLSSIPACCCCCILHEKPSPHQDVVHARLQLIARLEHENWDQRSSTCLGSIWEKGKLEQRSESQATPLHQAHDSISDSQCCVNLDLDQHTLVVPLIGDGVVNRRDASSRASQRLPEHLKHRTMTNSENIRLQLPMKGAMSGGWSMHEVGRRRPTDDRCR